MEVRDGVLIKVREKDLKLLKRNPKRFWRRIKKIGPYAFAFLENLEEIVIPKGIESIGESCFCRCENLSKVVIADSVTSIGKEAFTNCYKLFEVYLPYNISSLPEECFACCENLEEIDIPENVTSIGTGCFRNCHALKKLGLSWQLKVIGDKAFQSCWGLKEIILPFDTQEIGKQCFSECKNLEKVTFYAINPSIGEFCFDKCDRFETIIMYSYNKIGKGAFNRSLKNIIVNNKVFKIEYNGEYFPKKSGGSEDDKIAIENEKFTKKVINIMENRLEDDKQIKFPLDFFEKLSEEEKKEILKKENNKYFARIYNKFIKNSSELYLKNNEDFYILAYKLGCFSSETIEINGDEVVIGEVMCDYLEDMISRKKINLVEICKELSRSGRIYLNNDIDEKENTEKKFKKNLGLR